MLEKRPVHSTTYAESILKCMDYAMATNENTILMGQGIGDFKGIFGTTTGLAEKYGTSRVIESPIAEEMMTGFCLGAALNGIYPIMTHIRADFSLVTMNQIINLYAKYRYMFGGQFKPAGLIRLIIGRSWGQGAQHAQSLQSLFSHIPGIRVIMPYSANSIQENYMYEIDRADRLVISFEHRNLYELAFNVNEVSGSPVIPLDSKIERNGSKLTIAATSIMVLEALRAAQFLEDVYGISTEVIDITSPSNPDKELIFQSVRKTGHLLIADTSWVPYGVCAEITRIICEIDPSVLKAPVRSIGMQHTPCPTGKTLEDMFYPSVKTLVEECLISLGMEAHLGLPSGESYRDYYRKFRGPF